ncbi:MAG: MBL fold metallo-hydrolase [Anaerolineae bacterium]|nr:MBL fold metallo-hydrolase [Anaerolineae bacterium]
MIDRIQWLGHGSFLIQGPPLIYINPWRVPRTIFHADIILVSHDHYDHCSQADIEKLRGPDTIVISNDKVAQEIRDTTVLRPWQSLSVDRTSIKAVPAYSPNDWRHPQADGGLGFIISLNYYDIYYAGDTEIIPEMNAIKPDIAILPIDGNGTLSLEDAVEVVRMMRPQYAIPCNWGSALEGATRLEALAFERQASEYARVPMLT